MDQPTNAQLIDTLSAGSGTLAARMTEIQSAVSRADQQSQMGHLEYVKAVLAMPNIVVDQQEDLGFGLGSVSRHDERAAITGIQTDRLGATTVDIDFEMKVGSHTEASTQTDAKVGSQTEVSGNYGFLFAKGSFKSTLSAEVSHSNKQSRSTDMSARMSAQMHMERIPAAEGLAQMADCANEFSRKNNELRATIAGAIVDKLKQQIEDGEIDPFDMAKQGQPDQAAA